MNLKLWQQQLSNVISSGNVQSDAQQWFTSGNTPGLSVYRNNCEHALMNALAATYPIFRSIVGDVYFRELCRRYAEKYPCLGDGLNGYGESLAVVVDGCLATNELPVDYAYLSDLLKLEWLIQQVQFARPVRVFDLPLFSKLTPMQQEHIVFELSDSVRLISSRFALFELWWRHRHALNSVDIKDEAEWYYFCVYRRAYMAEVCRLNRHEYLVLRAIDNGVMMQDLLGETDSDADLSCLVSFVQKGWIDGYSITGDSIC